MTAAVDRVAVVIPARDEQDRLAGCLRAVQKSLRRLHIQHPGVVTCAVVVLDSCRDGSSLVVARFPEVHAVTTSAGRVGAARRIGLRYALDVLDSDPARCWIANTDADSLVAENWLTAHLALAAHGADLVLGTVTPSRDELVPITFDTWSARHPQHDGHPYVHGANLGIRGETYLRVGGFPPVAEHEDVELTMAVRRLGGQVISTASCPVITSGRTVGRTPGGFAGYLAALVN